MDNPVDNFLKKTPNPIFLPGFSKVGFCFLINATKIFGFILCHFWRIEPLWVVYGVGCTGVRASKGCFCEDLGGSVLGLGYGFCVAGRGVIPGDHVFLRLPWWERFYPILINVARLQYKIPNTPWPGIICNCTGSSTTSSTKLQTHFSLLYQPKVRFQYKTYKIF